MCVPHRIRLRGPWQCLPLSRNTRLADGTLQEERTDLPSPIRLTLPTRAFTPFGDDFCGTVCLQRTFNRPTGLELETRVYLVLHFGKRRGLLCLNDEPLGTIQPTADDQRFLLESGLLSHNRLQIELQLDNHQDGVLGDLVGEIFLEIYSPASGN